MQPSLGFIEIAEDREVRIDLLGQAGVHARHAEVHRRRHDEGGAVAESVRGLQVADELDETADVSRREIMLRVPRIDELGDARDSALYQRLQVGGEIVESDDSVRARPTMFVAASNTYEKGMRCASRAPLSRQPTRRAGEDPAGPAARRPPG